MVLESCSFNGANLSLEQCKSIVEGYNTYQAGQTNLLNQILGSPFFWIMISVSIVMIVIYLIFGRKGKGDPSTRPFYGREVREGLMKQEMNRRLTDIGNNVKNVRLDKGLTKIGMVTAIEHDTELFQKTKIDQKTGKVSYEPDYWYRIDHFKYRKLGFFPWLKALFGFGFKYITLTPESYKINPENKIKIISIDPTVHLIHDSGVWSVLTQRAVQANENLLVKADNENLHGHVLDNVRRQSVYHASVANSMEKSSHDAALKEQERKNKIGSYT